MLGVCGEFIYLSNVYLIITMLKLIALFCISEFNDGPGKNWVPVVIVLVELGFIPVDSKKTGRGGPFFVCGSVCS